MARLLALSFILLGVASCSPSASYLPDLPFHDGNQMTKEEVRAFMDANTTNPFFQTHRERHLNGSHTGSLGYALNGTAQQSYVYNSMELLRQYGLSFCGTGNLGAWSTGKTAAGDRASLLTCSNGSWKNFAQFGCLDTLTSVIGIDYGTAVKTAASPSDVHSFEDNNCQSANKIHRKFSQSVSTSNTYDWSNTIGLETSNTLEVSAGVPAICHVSDSFSITLSTSTTTSNSNTKTDSESIASSYDIPGHSKSTFQVIFAKTNFNLPYTNTLQFGGQAAFYCNKKVNGHQFWFPTVDFFLPKYSYNQIQCSGGSSPQCTLPGVFSAVSGTDYSTKSSSEKC